MKSSKLVWAVSTKADGNMSFKWGNKDEVMENRKRFLLKHNLQLEDGAMMSVLDTDIVTIVGTENKNKTIETDALLTEEKGVVLMLLTADCLPVTFFDSKNNILALAHCGWKSTDANLAQIVVNKMRSMNSNPENILINIGPSVRKESYKFETVNQKNDPKWKKYLYKDSDALIHVDPVGYVTEQLLSVGVAKNNIKIIDIDTIADKNHYSHYRSVRTGESEGRFLTIACLN